MQLLGWVLSLFTICSYYFLVIFLTHSKGYPGSISHFSFTPKPMKSTHKDCRYPFPLSPVERWSASITLSRSRTKTKPKTRSIFKFILGWRTQDVPAQLCEQLSCAVGAYGITSSLKHWPHKCKISQNHKIAGPCNGLVWKEPQRSTVFRVKLWARMSLDFPFAL